MRTLIPSIVQTDPMTQWQTLGFVPEEQNSVQKE